MRGVLGETEEKHEISLFSKEENMGLAGWLRNLKYLGCRDLFHSYIHTVEFLLLTFLFYSLPLPLTPQLSTNLFPGPPPPPPPPPFPSPPPHILSLFLLFHKGQSKAKRNKDYHHQN